MGIYWKKIKKRLRRFWRKRRNRFLLLGAVGAVSILGLILVLSGDREEPPITQGNTSTITLVAAGDLNVTDKIADADFSTTFLDVAETFARADVSLMNLEGLLCGAPYGSQTASAPQALAEQLAAMGVDLVQMANSCCVKNGISGLSQTLDNLRRAGLEPLGAYASNAEADAAKGYSIFSVNGVRVAFVAFTKGMDGMGLPIGSERCVNLLYTDYTTTYQKVNTAGITTVLQAVREEKPDITVALVHWGSENVTTVSPTQKKIAKLMLQNGVDAVIGTHSHQVQSVEYDEENHTLIAWSLGDLFGDGSLSGNRYSILLELEITKNWDTGAAAVTGWSYTPVYTLSPEREEGALRVVRILPALEAYENNHISRVSSTAYENMRAALTQIEKRLSPTE